MLILTTRDGRREFLDRDGQPYRFKRPNAEQRAETFERIRREVSHERPALECEPGPKDD